ncbi:hypothetical protein LF1_47470 [Rubripirellula obstinata]|uniref:Uncharacterized protein n=1 Tax=Rubripirellula obstinata TaxID=406547 RepID=A0A5B1CQD4_9BACT|nr:hypothetical protein [Rubripirellula obstinata]KAA1262185.1 hypothetical protein LF1_47470 [Rubripirellula obstinata]
MSPSVNKFLPPGMVVAATLYFGWPPAKPLIQSDSIVRATAVRWKRDDLKKPATVSIDVDPFASVLVVSDELEVEEETGKLVPATRPAGPDPTVLQQGLVLSGIADMGGRKWAILNGRPRLPGDTLVTDDLNRHPCEVVSVGHDHVVVRCEETIAQVEIRNSKQNSSASNLPGVKLHPVTEIESAAPESASVQEASEIPPPPNFTLSHNQTSLRRNPCRTY